MKTLSLLILAIIFHFTNCSKETVTLLQNELEHHQISKPEIDEGIFKNKIVTGDMILDKINLATEKDLSNYLKQKFQVRIDKYDFLEAIQFMNSVNIHNYFYIYSFKKIVLKEYIALATRSSAEDKNLVDLFMVYTEVTLSIPDKNVVEKSWSTCVVLFGYELCKSVGEVKDIAPYDFKEIMKFEKAAKYYSFLKFKEVINNYVPQIYLHTETEFDLIEVLREYQTYTKEITRSRFLQDEFQNYQNLKNTIYDIYSRVFPHMKVLFTENLAKYSTTVMVDGYFKTLERSSKLQMIKGISEEDLKTYLTGLKKRLLLPPSKHDEFDSVVESLEWSDGLRWHCVDLLFSLGEEKKVKYAAILANRDSNSKYSFLVADVQSSFTLYDKLIIINRSSSEKGFIFGSEFEFKEVPESLEIDAENMMFLMKNIAFKTYAKYFNLSVDLS